MKSVIKMYKGFFIALFLHFCPTLIIVIITLLFQLITPKSLITSKSETEFYTTIFVLIFSIIGIIIFYKNLDNFVDLYSELGAFVNLIYNFLLFFFIMVTLKKIKISLFGLPPDILFVLLLTILIINLGLIWNVMINYNPFFLFDVPRNIYLILLLFILPIIAIFNSLLADTLWEQVKEFEYL